jgi:hypothetical protein
MNTGFSRSSDAHTEKGCAHGDVHRKAKACLLIARLAPNVYLPDWNYIDVIR